MAEIPRVRQWIYGAGAQPDDLDDLMQEVAFGAFRAITAGRYRPDPTVRPRIVLRSWLIGIAFRQFSHLREFAREGTPAARDAVLGSLPRAGAHSSY